MFTSYLIDKTGFTLLCALVGGENVIVPGQLCETVDDNNYNEVLKRLSDIGYIYHSGKRVDIERTIDFLISNIVGAQEVNAEPEEKRVIFRCSKLIIVVEEDRLSPRKCRIVPIKDEEMLEEYFSEYSGAGNNEEE